MYLSQVLDVGKPLGSSLSVADQSYLFNWTSLKEINTSHNYVGGGRFNRHSTHLLEYLLQFLLIHIMWYVGHIQCGLAVTSTWLLWNKGGGGGGGGKGGEFKHNCAFADNIHYRLRDNLTLITTHFAFRTV